MSDARESELEACLRTVAGMVIASSPTVVILATINGVLPEPKITATGGFSDTLESQREMPKIVPLLPTEGEIIRRFLRIIADAFNAVHHGILDLKPEKVCKAETLHLTFSGKGTGQGEVTGEWSLTEKITE
jgi:hypothetical protein